MILRPQKGYVRNIFRYTCDKEGEIKCGFFGRFKAHDVDLKWVMGLDGGKLI